jgi:hypothetical protein
VLGLNLGPPRAWNLNRLGRGQIGTSRFQFSKYKIQDMLPLVYASGDIMRAYFVAALRCLDRRLQIAVLKYAITRRDPNTALTPTLLSDFVVPRH